MRRLAFISLTVAFFMMISFVNEGKALEKVVVGYPGISADLAHLWIFKEAGIFEKYGLDVEPVYFKSGTNLIQSLTAGEIKIGVNAILTTIRAMIAGSNLTIIGTYINKFPYSFYTSKGITRPEQLKGKTVACSSFGTASHFSVVLSLRKLGLVPGKDVTILQVGDQSARFAAMEAGSIQGITIAPPLTLLADKKGWNPLVDLAKSGIPYVHEGLIANKTFVKNNPETVKNFMKGFLHGIKFVHTEKAKTIELLARFMKLDMQKDKEALEEGYDDLKDNTDKKPIPPVEGVITVLNYIAEEDPRAKNARPEQFLDISIVQELDKSGFIDSLYK